MNFLEYLKKNRANDENESNADNIFMRNIITSILAVVICIIVFSSSTYAWYTKSIEKTETIQASVYILDISASPSDQITEGQSASGNTTYRLSSGVEYTLSVYAVEDDTTNGSTGYIKLKVGDRIYVSEQIDRGHTLEFKLTFTTDTEIEIIECWGISSLDDSERDIFSNKSYLDLSEME